MDAEVKTVRAYSTLHDTKENDARAETKFPHKSFQNVMKKEVENSDTEILIVQATSVDITNLKATKDNIKKYPEYFKQEIVISAANLFTTVENTLKANTAIKKAVILKQIPRYESLAHDPQGLKAALSQLYNNSIMQQWLSSPLKDRITVGTHERECAGGVRDSRYRQGTRYDGIHMLGPSGRKAYTESVLMILHNAGHIRAPPPSYYRRYHDIKTTKPPVSYKITKPSLSQDEYICPTQDTDYLNDRDIRIQKQHYQSRYTIPTSNRFSQFNQGNY